MLAIALVSGATALIYQMVWLRWFQVLFGSTAHAASATLCAFFAGLALGAEIFGRLAPRLGRPLLVYAGIELAAALLALAVPGVFALYDLLYPSLYATFSDLRAAFVVVKFLLAMLAMVPPALLLGGTFPILATAYVSHPDELGPEAGRLYAVNTLGAAAGSAAGSVLAAGGNRRARDLRGGDRGGDDRGGGSRRPGEAPDEAACPFGELRFAW